MASAPRRVGRAGAVVPVGPSPFMQAQGIDVAGLWPEGARVAITGRDARFWSGLAERVTAEDAEAMVAAYARRGCRRPPKYTKARPSVSMGYVNGEGFYPLAEHVSADSGMEDTMTGLSAHRPLFGLCMLACACGAVAAGASATSAHERIVCPRVELALRDGRVRPDAWEKAAAFDLVLTGAGAAPEHATSGRVMCDGENLYVKVISAAPGRLAKPKPLARDDRRITSQHDNLQLFITPEPKPDRYFRLAMDRAGNIWDSAYSRGGTAALGDRWQPEWRLTVNEIPGGWAAELIVPFAAFGVDAPKPGDLWRFKLGRYGEDLPLTMWPFNPTSSFHVPVNDGALYFETENLLEGGDFDDAPLGPTAPPHWTVSPAPEEGMGEVKVVADTVRAAQRRVELHET